MVLPFYRSKKLLLLWTSNEERYFMFYNLKYILKKPFNLNTNLWVFFHQQTTCRQSKTTCRCSKTTCRQSKTTVNCSMFTNRSKICHLQHLGKFQSYYYAAYNLVQNVNCWNVKLIVIFLLVIFSESFPHRFMSILSVSYLENNGNICTVLWKGTKYIFSDIN